MNYILENYESLVRDIKNPKFSLKPDVLDSFEEWQFEDFMIHSISFKEVDGSTTYSINQTFHSLHPNALEFENFNAATTSKYSFLLGEIESELQIEQQNREYFWITDQNEMKLYIKVLGEFLELTDNIRYFIYCSKMLKEENEKIENDIKIKVLKSKSTDEIDQYIKKKQQAFDNLTSGLIKRINPDNAADLYTISENYDRIDCLKLVHLFSERLLTFIETDYNNFLNKNTRLSLKTASAIQEQLMQKMGWFKIKVLQANLDPKLLKSALEPICKLENGNLQNRITNNEYNYCTHYISKSYLILLHQDIEVNNDTMQQWLYAMNQNSLSFFDYKTDTFNNELNNCENSSQKLETLLRLLKASNQIVIQNTIGFKEKLPAINIQIKNWLTEEIEYLKNIMVLEASLPQSTFVSNKNKIMLGLSVAQISCFSSLLVQSGIIKHDNHSEVFRVLSDNFKTKNTDQISVDSLKSKFYNIENTTKTAIHEKIIELLNLSEL